MSLRPLLVPIAVGSTLLLGACQSPLGGSCHKPQAYAAAQELPPLRVPAGLDGPETESALEIPPLDAPEVPPDPEGPCLEAPPAITAPPLPRSAESIAEEAAARPRRRSTEAGPSAGGAQEESEPRGRRPSRRPR